MAQKTVRFKTPYGSYAPETIFSVDEASKKISPFTSGEAYTESGFQFGQEQQADAGAFAGFSLGAPIRSRAEALEFVKKDLNQFQNNTFGEQEGAPKRQSSAIEEEISKETAAFDSARGEFGELRKRMSDLTAPNYEQSYRNLRAEQGVPQLEQDFLGVRQTRRELPSTERAATGNAAVITEGQLGSQIQQKDIPLEAREANLIDRLKLAGDFVNTAVNLKEKDFNTARQAIGDAINLVGETINLSKGELQQLYTRKNTERQIQDLARTFAVDNRITAPFYEVGGTIYRTSDGKAYTSDQEFFSDAKVRSYREAGQRGLIQDSFTTPKERELALNEKEFAFNSGIKLEELVIKRGELELKNAELALKQNPGLDFDANMKVLQQFLGQSKPFLDVQSAYNRILSTDDSPAGDLALIFNYMKMLDPGSVVREGEQATAQNAAGVPDRIRNWYNKIISGEKLAPEQRKDFRTQAGNLFNAKQQEQQALSDTFSGFAGKFPGVDPSIAVPDLASVVSDPDAPVPLSEMLRDPSLRKKAFEMKDAGIADDVIEQALNEALGSKKKMTKAETPYLKTLGKITAFGSSKWDKGLDIDLVKGQPVRSPVSGEVIAARKNGGFGLQIKIRLQDGKEIWLSHLDRFSVVPGTKVSAGQVIGLGGNTGTVITGPGGDGSHLDVTMKNSKGEYLSAKEVYSFLKQINV